MLLPLIVMGEVPLDQIVTLSMYEMFMSYTFLNTLPTMSRADLVGSDAAG